MDELDRQIEEEKRRLKAEQESKRKAGEALSEAATQREIAAEQMTAEVIEPILRRWLGKLVDGNVEHDSSRWDARIAYLRGLRNDGPVEVAVEIKFGTGNQIDLHVIARGNGRVVDTNKQFFNWSEASKIDVFTMQMTRAIDPCCAKVVALLDQ